MFPIMLYRLFGKDEKFDFDDPKNSLIVNNFGELEKALDDGWLAHPLLKGEGDAADHDSEEKRFRGMIKEWKRENARAPEGLVENIRKRLRS